MIVDTDVLIDVMQGDSKVTRKIAVLEEEGTPLAISTVSLSCSVERKTAAVSVV